MEQKNTFTQGNILKQLILFAFPVLFALFLQAMYGQWIYLLWENLLPQWMCQRFLPVLRL